MNVIQIRYTNPDTTPSYYSRGLFGQNVTADTIMYGDYWTLRGPVDQLAKHITAVRDAGNLDDVAWGFSRTPGGPASILRADVRQGCSR